MSVSPRHLSILAILVAAVVGVLLLTTGKGPEPGTTTPGRSASGAGDSLPGGKGRGPSGGARPVRERVPREPAEALAALRELGVDVVTPVPGRLYYELALKEMPVDEDGTPLFSSGEAFLEEVVLTALELDQRVRKFTLDGESLSLADLGAIGQLEELEVFDLANAGEVTDLAPLGQLERMRELSLRTCPGISDLAPLHGLKRITDVSLNDTGVTDLAALGRNNTLRTVHISHGTPVKDLSPLSTCSNLKSLTLAFVEPDTTSLANLPRLQSLSLIDVPLADANALQGLTRLRTLQLRGTGLTGLEPLAGLRDLRYLGVESPHITRLNPLYGLENLESVSLVGTEVAPVEVELLRDRLPETRIELSPAPAPPR